MFDCDKCGLCCRNIHKIPQLKEYDLGNGVCRYLTSNNLCSIYENRPDICNSEKMYELYFKFIMTKEDYIIKNLEGCKKIKSLYKKDI